MVEAIWVLAVIVAIGAAIRVSYLYIMVGLRIREIERDAREYHVTIRREIDGAYVNEEIKNSLLVVLFFAVSLTLLSLTYRFPALTTILAAAVVLCNSVRALAMREKFWIWEDNYKILAFVAMLMLACGWSFKLKG